MQSNISAYHMTCLTGKLWNPHTETILLKEIFVKSRRFISAVLENVNREFCLFIFSYLPLLLIIQYLTSSYDHMNQQDTLVETTGVNLLRIFFSSLWELTLTVKRRFFFRGSFEGLEKQQMKLSLRELTNSEVTFAVCVFRMWLLIYRQRKLNEGIVRVSWRIRSFCVTNIRSSRVQPIWLDAAEERVEYTKLERLSRIHQNEGYQARASSPKDVMWKKICFFK